SAVESGGPAAQAGLKPGDVITKLDDMVTVGSVSPPGHTAFGSRRGRAGWQGCARPAAPRGRMSGYRPERAGGRRISTVFQR
ncbi:PDZ domain-containing protein, partial [Streptomyces asoensis]|uniref:PDZ domain-containing protein n=1 Tax=Streptomyces asoensis TaxID=249586 RepID=UPI0033EF437F